MRAFQVIRFRGGGPSHNLYNGPIGSFSLATAPRGNPAYSWRNRPMVRISRQQAAEILRRLRADWS